MSLPIVPLAAGGALLLFLMSKSSSASSGSHYSQAPADGSKPPVKEPAPSGKSWKEMPPALQEQVASALGALGVSPATGELSGTAVTADAIRMATQTAALCESQGFYEVAKTLQGYIAKAAPTVPTPPEAKTLETSAPPGLSAAQVEAIARTMTLDRNPKAIEQLLVTLAQLPQTPQRDNFIAMAQALLLQLQAAQSTTQTMQQIDQVIKSPGLPEIKEAVKPLPPVAIPVVQRQIEPPEALPQGPVVISPGPAVVTKPTATTSSPGWPQPSPAPASEPQKMPAAEPAAKPTLSLAQFADPSPNAALIKRGSKGESVKSWQRILKAFGYDIGRFGPNKDGVDGDFGAAVDAATRKFQAEGFALTRDPSIKVDGVVGPITRRLVLLRTAQRKAAAA